MLQFTMLQFTMFQFTPLQFNTPQLWPSRFCLQTFIRYKPAGMSWLFAAAWCLLSLAQPVPALAAIQDVTPSRYTLAGLEQPAEILIDSYGVPHIYANTHYDAFFVQGFNAARDRLWQIDLWRRRGLGELASILGPHFVNQDKAARLFLYRGPMRTEWLAYGSDAKQIAEAFTRGINAYVLLTRQDAALLPLEFTLLDYAPALWSPEDVVRIRSHGLWRNVSSEVQRARVACRFGLAVDAQRKLLEPPWETSIPEGLDPCDIPADVLQLYSLAQAPVDFSQASQFASATAAAAAAPAAAAPAAAAAGAQPGLQQDYANSLRLLQDLQLDAGSNNWAVAPARTNTGRPILANDPHRGHGVPSLRYIAHLVAPGLDVIGAGEPALPGISIGHNERIAFGLTIFGIDQEDLMVYQTRRDSYYYQGAWVPFEHIKTTIDVRGAAPVQTELLFTRHGPVIHQNAAKRRAFAVQAAWLEAGMAPYFGSIEYMRAHNWREFLGALNRWGAPAENQVYADIDGNIGYKPAGLTPIRKHYDGLLPVPGDGRYEWQGYYDMDQLPVAFNPPRGWVATANAMSLPADYPYKTIGIGFEWAAPWRIERIEAMLAAQPRHSVEDSVALQRDEFSGPAAQLLAALDLAALPAPANSLFQGWDYQLHRSSAAAALFEVWLSRHLLPQVMGNATGVADLALLGNMDNVMTIKNFLAYPPAKRQEVAADTLLLAIAETRGLLGANAEDWQWGAIHQMRFQHPLYNLVDAATRDILRMPAVARGGSGDSPNSTRYRPDFSVVSGASWRMVLDVGQWDRAFMTNAPGQSGNPNSPHYADLLQNWASDGSLPLLYTRQAVEQDTQQHLVLLPLVPDVASPAVQAR